MALTATRSPERMHRPEPIDTTYVLSPYEILVFRRLHGQKSDSLPAISERIVAERIAAATANLPRRSRGSI